jgi:hypothetical protein
MIAIGLNILLVVLLGAALTMGWRLNKRLKALRDSHDNFAVSVRELNTAAMRAEQGLATLRAATDEAAELLGERIERGRKLAERLERLTANAQAIAPREEPAMAGDPPPPVLGERERRLGALLSAAREPRPRPVAAPVQSERGKPERRAGLGLDDDLFEDRRQ